MTTKLILSFFIIIIFALTFETSNACTCAAEDFQDAYYRHQKRGTPFSIATVLSSTVNPPTKPQSPSSINQKRIYKLSVKKVFADCAPPVPYKATAVTSTQGSLCAVFLQTGITYLIPLKPGRGNESNISSCDSITPVNALTKEMSRFLYSQKLCCKGTC